MEKLVSVIPLLLRRILKMLSTPIMPNNINAGLNFFLDTIYRLKKMKSIFNMKGPIT